MNFFPPAWLPDWLFVVLYAVPPLIVLWVTHRLFQRFAPNWVLKDQDENMAAGGIASASAITGIVLAFVIALTNQASDTFQGDVGVEAAQLRNMDKLLIASGSPSSLSCRQPLMTYAQSIVQEEWPQLQNQQGSTQTANKLNALENCLITIKSGTTNESNLYLEIIKLSNQIAESRESRISNSAASLSSLFWMVMHLGLFLTIILCALSFYTPGQIRVINCCIQVISVSMLMALVMVLDHPYAGSNGITSDAIMDAITHMQKNK